MGVNLMEEISKELAKADSMAKSENNKVGMFIAKTAYQTLVEAALRPDPTPLWLSLWYQGEVCCLFADSNVGKSIYAVQIASEIAKKTKVLYFDFELSDKQFQLRYSDDKGELFRFPDNLLRLEIDPESLDVTNFEEALIANVENAAVQTGAKVLIIDNLTWLCSAAEKGDVAGQLMMNLMKLKKKHGWSLLVLTHTPKRPLTSPITQNDMAGSKKLYNFFDSVFSIGFSAKDPSLRYIKQLKVRYGGYTFDADNVIVASIEKIGSFLQFVAQGYSTEREHLKELSDKDLSEQIAEVKKLSAEGKSLREIAAEIGISKSKVDRLLKK